MNIINLSATMALFLVVAQNDDQLQHLLSSSRASIGISRCEDVRAFSMSVTFQRDTVPPTEGTIDFDWQYPDRFRRVERSTLADPTGNIRLKITRVSGFAGNALLDRLDGIGSPPAGLEPNTTGRLVTYQQDFLDLSTLLLLCAPDGTDGHFQYGRRVESPDGVGDLVQILNRPIAGDDDQFWVLIESSSKHIRILQRPVTVLSGVIKGAEPTQPLRPNERYSKIVRWYASDHKQFGRVSLPQIVRIESNGATMEEWRLTRAMINPSFSSDVFSPPGTRR